ncbi:trypsin-like protein [Anabaena sp. 90]|nr:trypsin-like protein [Anabaena sp. 90]
MLVLEKALERGYQIGYTNKLEKGMSGGPLLNENGQLIGVNGMHAYPLWDVPSVFIDGTPADEKLHQQIVRLSRLALKIVVMALGLRQEARGKSEEGLGDFTFRYIFRFFSVHLLKLGYSHR